jgi:hypothetical protein
MPASNSSLEAIKQLTADQLGKEKCTNPQKCPTSPPGGVSFAPDAIFYAAEQSTYYADLGTHYRPYKGKRAIAAGLRRHLENQGHTGEEIKALLAAHFDEIELDQAVDWVGKLAGYPRGIFKKHGRLHLVTEEAKLADPAPGNWPLIKSVIEQAFPDDDARAVFLAWLAGGIDAIRQSIHQPAPMLVMAGPAGAGKSLIAHISKMAMGGRCANPMTAWSGKLPWNDNLLASELLLIDDSVASTDPRARKSFGANFKEAIYAGEVEINTRRKSSISLRPVWRVMVCCNETPENLSIIPPLEDGIEDKIILLKVAKVETPMPACTPSEKDAFASALIDELPAFLHFLQSVQLPDHLADTASRSGVIAWKDQELLAAVREISPEARLENLLALAIEKGFIDLAPGESQDMTAAEVQSMLQDRDSPTSKQADGLLKYDALCGRLLSVLFKQGSPFVTDDKIVNGTKRYQITRPRVG